MSMIILVVLLGIAQGVAEFLPISSSGHLLVMGCWFGFDAESNQTLNIILHAGTLLAILVFYFKKLLSILWEPQRRRLIGLVIVGTIPAGVAGVALKITALDGVLFASPWVAVCGFVFTATMLLAVFGVPWKKTDNIEDDGLAAEKISFLSAFLIGLAQALAITPGISRSGSTISAGVLRKMRKADAAEFSFLLAIPAIGGAAVLEFKDLCDTGLENVSGSMWGIYAIGFAVSAIVGYASLAGLIAMLRRGKLGWFACYLYVAAAVVATVQICKIF